MMSPRRQLYQRELGTSISSSRRRNRKHQIKRIWKCMLCKFQNNDKPTVIRHMKNEHECHPYQCRLCLPSRSDYRDRMLTHAKEKHGTDDLDSVVNVYMRPLEEAIAYEQAKQQEKYRRPTSAEGAPCVNRRFICKVCQYRTNDIPAIKLHGSLHKADMTAKYSCIQCSYFVSQVALLEHHYRLHVGGHTADLLLDALEAAELRQRDLKPNKTAKFTENKDYTESEPVTPAKASPPDKENIAPDTPSTPVPACAPTPVLKVPADPAPPPAEQPRLSLDHQTSLSDAGFDSENSDSDDCDDYGMKDELKVRHELIETRFAGIQLSPKRVVPLGCQDDNVVPVYVMSSDGHVAGSARLQKHYKCERCPFRCVRHCQLETHDQGHKKSDEVKRSSENLRSCKYCEFVSTEKLITRHLKVHTEKYRPVVDPIVDYFTAEVADSERGDYKMDESDQDSVLYRMKVDRQTTEQLKTRPPKTKRPRLELSALPADSSRFYLRADDVTEEDLTAPAVLELSLSRVWSCSHCPYSTAQQERLGRHVMLHDAKDTRRCQYCDYGTYSRHYTENHQALHLSPHPNLLSTFDTETLSAISDPQSNSHQELSIDCLLAGSDDSQVRGVYDVKTADHLDLLENSDDFELKDFQCEYCPFGCGVQADMFAHLRGHVTQAPCKCPYCTYSAESEEAIEAHKKVHFNM